MPHYKDGTEAKPGDVVRGKGYNLKDENGELREFVGTLLHVTPDATACNVQVGVVEVCAIGPFDPDNASHLLNLGRYEPLVALPDNAYAKLRVEYGQADHFEKIA